MCPRCGYDQSGACGAWQTECPLTGTCPECGLLFEWADAFNLYLKRLPWLFEHKHPASPGVLRALRSWFMALIPPWFWRRVTPAYASTWVVLLWPVVFFGSFAFVVGGVRLAYALAKKSPLPMRMTNTGGVWTATQPPTLEALGLRAQEAWFIPWYPVHVARWDPQRVGTTMLETWAAPCAVVAASVATGLTLMSLTTSRRICGVKGSHILRAMVYRLAPLGVLYAAWCVGQLAWMQWSMLGIDWQTGRTLWMGSLVLPMLWGAWWWYVALTKGWQMPQARLVAVLMGVVDILACLATYMLMSPYVAGLMLNSM